MLDKLRLVHYLRISSVLLVVTWIFIQFGGGGDDHDRYKDIFRQFRNQRAVFVDDFLSHDVSGRFEGEGLSRLCATKKWTPGLIMSCDAVPGSIADVKNGILTCIRISIEIGAEVILPNIMLRSEINLADTTPHDVGPRRGVPLEHFFDRSHLVNTLGEYCPELKIHNTLDNFFDDPNVLSPVKLDLYKVPGVRTAANLPGSAGRIIEVSDKDENKDKQLNKLIHAFLDKESPPRDRKYPFRVELRPTPAYSLPAYADTPTLRNYFGRIVQVRQDLRGLAASVLFNLQKAFDLQMDPRKGIDIDAFVAVELRTQPDPHRFPEYEVQASDALAFVVASNVSQVYLTEGATPEHVKAFTDRCKDFHVTVVTKEDLVEGADAALLSRLSYDERFLVDYEVALRAGLFTGHGQSSFAWNVALRREFAFGDAGSKTSEHLNGMVRWYNQYSTLYGKDNIGDDLRRAIWP